MAYGQVKISAVNFGRLEAALSAGMVQLEYRKKDGSIRQMVATKSANFLDVSGQSIMLKGGTNNSNPLIHLTIFSIADMGWRTLLKNDEKSGAGIVGWRTLKVA